MISGRLWIKTENGDLLPRPGRKMAFAKHEEMLKEGGIPARSKRYYDNNHLLIERMKEMGIDTYIKDHQGPIITTFLYPEHHTFSFTDMYQYIKERGYAIYPGKLTDTDQLHWKYR